MPETLKECEAEPKTLEDTGDLKYGHEVSPTHLLRRRTQERKPVKRLCLPLNHVLYTDSRETNCLQEAK